MPVGMPLHVRGTRAAAASAAASLCGIVPKPAVAFDRVGPNRGGDEGGPGAPASDRGRTTQEDGFVIRMLPDQRVDAGAGFGRQPFVRDGGNDAMSGRVPSGRGKRQREREKNRKKPHEPQGYPMHTSCTDHMVAWRVRNALGLDQLSGVAGVSGDAKRPDNIVFDITANPDGTGGAGQAPNGTGGSRPERRRFRSPEVSEQSGPHDPVEGALIRADDLLGKQRQLLPYIDAVGKTGFLR